MRAAAVSILAIWQFGCATTPAPAPEAATAAAAPDLPVVAEPERDPLSPPPDVAAVPPDAVRDASGLASKRLKAGTGAAHPRSFSVVRVHYSGWTLDGALFDSSVKRGAPAEFPLDGVIAGWRAVVKQMVVGEKRRVWIPEELAYKGREGPQGMLVFEIELLEIVKP